MKLNQRTLAFAGIAVSGFLLLGSFCEALFSLSVEDKVIRIGKEVAAELMSDLKKALIDAMREGGPTAAIQVCKVEAPLLTQRVSDNHPDIEVRRTTLRFRNPNNRPDPVDEGVLNELSQMKKRGDRLPEYSVRKIGSGATMSYRFYQPLLASGLCLNCHGSKETISREVNEVIHREYPEDQAVGYDSGDLRGVISVEIPAHTLVQN